MEQELSAGFYCIKAGLSTLGLRLYLQYAREFQSLLKKWTLIDWLIESPRGELPLLWAVIKIQKYTSANMLWTLQACSRDNLGNILIHALEDFYGILKFLYLWPQMKQ